MWEHTQGGVMSQLCGHNAISILWGNASYYVYLSGEDLSHHSNKIESVGLRKCPFYRYYHSYKHLFLTACPTLWWKNSWHRYDTKKLRRCHPTYRQGAHVPFVSLGPVGDKRLKSVTHG